MSPEILLPQRFPRGTAQLEHLPQQLFLWGQLPAPPWVAIVGTRRPSDEGAEFARNLARELGERGIAVASGGAFGIDSAAHQGALDVGAQTVVVAPAGFDKPYPQGNAELFQRVISQRGAYLSRVAADEGALRSSFFPRNQLLVACSEVVVLVEAPLRSGARNAAAWARRLGRPLYIVPHAPWTATGHGNLAELKLGGKVLSNYKDVLAGLQSRNWPPLWSTHGQAGADWPAERSATPGVQSSLPFALATADSQAQSTDAGSVPSAPASRARLAVEAALGRGAIHPDEIQRETGLSIAQVQVILTELQLS